MNYIRANPVTGAAAPAVAKINVNSAPKEVLMCLPGFTETDEADRRLAGPAHSNSSNSSA